MTTKTSTLVLDFLAAAGEARSTGAVAEALGEDAVRIGALLNYAAKCGRVEKVGTEGLMGLWEITDTGRECLAEETGGAEPIKPAPPATKPPKASPKKPAIDTESNDTLAMTAHGQLLVIDERGSVKQAIDGALLGRIVEFVAARSR
jgi:hypothetical protein